MVASASGWTFHGDSGLLCAKGNLHGLYDPLQKSHGVTSVVLYWSMLLTSLLALKRGSTAPALSERALNTMVMLKLLLVL